MNPVIECINHLYNILIGQIPNDEETLIKIHTRNLHQGDISFPTLMKNWFRLTKKTTESGLDTIFTYQLGEFDENSALNKIVEKLNKVNIRIEKSKVSGNNAFIFLERPVVFSWAIKKVLNDQEIYGKFILFSRNITLIGTEKTSSLEHLDLTTLRLHIVRSVIENILKLTCNSESEQNLDIHISQNRRNNDSELNLICGPVVNELGVKNTLYKASQYFSNRTCNMQLMAQHRYRVNVTSSSDWAQLFSRLGEASVSIELLSNKPHKSVKMPLNTSDGPNKGPSFIFYNCARLSILLKEFDNKVSKRSYPHLPDFDNVNFSLLIQPEEWELLFAYILQFPYVIKKCVREIENDTVNPQHLVTFLSSLSSVFSVYYRRTRILTEAKDHMMGTIYARIYLLKALQIVFHNALRLLNIEPVQEM